MFLLQIFVWSGYYTTFFIWLPPLNIANYVLKVINKIYQIVEYLCRSVEKWCTPLERRENVVHHMNKTNRHSKPIHTFKKHNRSRSVFPHLHKTKQVKICFHTFKKHKKVNPIDSRQIIPKVGLMLRILDLISLARLACLEP